MYSQSVAWQFWRNQHLAGAAAALVVGPKLLELQQRQRNNKYSCRRFPRVSCGYEWRKRAFIRRLQSIMCVRLSPSLCDIQFASYSICLAGWRARARVCAKIKSLLVAPKSPATCLFQPASQQQQQLMVAAEKAIRAPPPPPPTTTTTTDR